MKIAVIEDSKKIGYILFKAFEKENVDVELFESLDEAKKIQPNQFAAFIVDYNLKQGTGIEVIQSIRKKGDHSPILMLTVRDSLDDKLTAFDAGADDYLTKPFELPELMARINSLVKRGHNIIRSNIKIGNLAFDFENMQISINKNVIPFSKKEYQLIKYLLLNRGQILEKHKILENVWVHSEEKDPNIINVYINRIRKKLQTHKADNFIENVRGFGYIVK